MTRSQRFCYTYARPALTVDLVIMTRERKPRVLLIRRKHEPFAGLWAFPGGFVDENEPLEAAARRELREETGMTVESLAQLGTFGDPGRDPRGWTVSVVFCGRVGVRKMHPVAGDDAAEVAWHAVAAPPRLAFDHARILNAAVLRFGMASTSRRPARKTK